MNADEKNILIINVSNDMDKVKIFSDLLLLDNISQVLFINNTLCEFVYSVLYRVFCYPFKNKSEKATLYLDGFRGYLPLFLANFCDADEINFYEEGESIYLKDALLNELRTVTLKDKIVRIIKKILFVKKVDLFCVKNIYVRDTERFSKAIDACAHGLKYTVHELDVISKLKALSNNDKTVLKNVFLSKVSVNKFENKKAIVLTQPLYMHGILSKEETLSLFNKELVKLQSQNYQVFLKLHPRERDDIYLKDGVLRINGDFPFELLALLDVEFDKGITYNSTAINCKLIKEKVLLSV
ncbi:polysialyltransferase family glycosyltransferase [Aeromonas caviae]